MVAMNCFNQDGSSFFSNFMHHQLHTNKTVLIYPCNFCPSYFTNSKFFMLKEEGAEKYSYYFLPTHFSKRKTLSKKEKFYLSIEYGIFITK